MKLEFPRAGWRWGPWSWARVPIGAGRALWGNSRARLGALHVAGVPRSPWHPQSCLVSASSPAESDTHRPTRTLTFPHCLTHIRRFSGIWLLQMVPLSGSPLSHLYQKNTPDYFMRAQLNVPGSKKVILIHPDSLSTSPSFQSPNCTFLLTCPGPPC